MRARGLIPQERVGGRRGVAPSLLLPLLLGAAALLLIFTFTVRVSRQAAAEPPAATPALVGPATLPFPTPTPPLFRSCHVTSCCLRRS